MSWISVALVSMPKDSLFLIFIGCFSLLRLLSVDTWNRRTHPPLCWFMKSRQLENEVDAHQSSKKSECCWQRRQHSVFCTHNIDIPLSSAAIVSSQSTLRFLSPDRWLANNRLSARLLLYCSQWMNYTLLPVDIVSEYVLDLTRL